MDMLNKLKKRVLEDGADESETEGASSSGAKGGGPPSITNSDPLSNDPVALQKEVTELKEHINKNYFIYVRRLEKRKERVKELEEYAKILLGDNEKLNEKLKDYEDCQKQLKDYRDNLEQLEGFQSQELAKVKHMLLSAETALEKETQTRKNLEAEVICLKETSPKSNEAVDALQKEIDKLQSSLQEQKDNEKVKLEEIARAHEEKVARLEERLGHQDLDGDERLVAVTKERDQLEEKLQVSESSLSETKTKSEEEAKDLRKQLQSLQDDLEGQKKKVASLTLERDQAKNALLEHEIAQHEKQTSLGEEKDKVKLEMARLNTEMETLQVTLDRRDKELKAKKEEFRVGLTEAEKSRDEAVKQLEAKTLRISSLEAEKEVLKGKLVEESNNLLSVESRLEDLQRRHHDLETRSKSTSDDRAKVIEEFEELRKSTGETATKLELLTDKHDALNADYDKIVIQLDETMTSRSEFQNRWKLAEEKVISLGEEVSELKGQIQEKDSTFQERMEQSDLVIQLKSQVNSLEDDLSDKKNIIKVHQQKMNDMKKTFQKELRSSANNSAVELTNGRHTPPNTLPMMASTPLAATHRPSPPRSNSSASYDPMAVEDMVPMTDINIKYLKHVIFKFFTSREYEAKNLTKAMAALLHFTRDEEKLFQEHLDWKMSWFGTKPRLGSGQFALSIDPTKK